MRTTKTGWLLCDGSSYATDTYQDLVTLFDGAGLDEGEYPFKLDGENPARSHGDATTDILTFSSNHGYVDEQLIYIEAQAIAANGALDNWGVPVYVIYVDADEIQIEYTIGGGAIDLRGAINFTSWDSFIVPDLRGRAAIGADNPTGSSDGGRLDATYFGKDTTYAGDDVGNIGGEGAHQLGISEIPAHTHNYVKHTSTQNMADTGSGHVVQKGTSTLPTTSAGGGGSHSNFQPSLCVNWFIKT
jgi:microcystin-dependent protein